MVELAQTVAWTGHWVALFGQLVDTTGQTVWEVADAQMVSRAGHWVWVIGQDVDVWRGLLAEPGVCLHLYGKHEARAGRKMGHVTRIFPE